MDIVKFSPRIHHYSKAMFLFTVYVDNEYTAKKMEGAAKKLGYNMMWQWVKKTKDKSTPSNLVIACDFHT